MMDGVDHSTPTKDEIKLIIDNSLLEMEKRFTKTVSDTLADQNRTYMAQIITLTEKVTAISVTQTAHENSIKGFKGMVTQVGAVCAVLGGFVGFLISQLTK